MSRYIKYLDNGGKNMSFKVEDESMYLNALEFGIKLECYWA